MAVLDELHKSISDMTDEELAETFRQIRLSRRTGANIKKRKTKSKTPAAPKALTPPPVSSISPEMAAQLLAQIEK